MRFFVLLMAAVCCPAQNQLDGHKALFTVLAAIHAAGYDAGLNSPSNHPLRNAVREAVASRKPASVAAIGDFMRQHRQENDLWTLRQYVSYALLVDGPPEFRFRTTRNQLPPDVAAMEALGPILARFHAEAGMDELWQKSQPALDEAIARYHGPVVAAVQELNAYLRIPSGVGYMGRTFQVVVDLLGPPNQIHLHSLGDDYFIVVTHSPEPQIADIRTAYLHYLLDPLATKYAAQIDEKKALGDYAQGSAVLADHYKQDFLLLATRSLIRAVESRVLFSAAARQAAYVDQAMKEGFVLAAHFAERLPVYEKQEQAMRLYFPEIVAAIDLKREERRLEKLEFASAPAERRARPAPKPAGPELSPAQRKMEEAETLYASKEFPRAREAFLAVTSMTGERPLQARAYYGLARIAALNRDPDLAEKLFARTLDLEPEPAVKAWSLVYLARLSEAAGERDRAMQYYQSALGVQGASEAAQKAARQALASSQRGTEVAPPAPGLDKKEIR